MKTEEPIFNVPGPVLCFIGLMVAVHIGRSFLSPDDGHLVRLRCRFHSCAL